MVVWLLIKGQNYFILCRRTNYGNLLIVMNITCSSHEIYACMNALFQFLTDLLFTRFLSDYGKSLSTNNIPVYFFVLDYIGTHSIMNFIGEPNSYSKFMKLCFLLKHLYASQFFSVI